MARKKCGLAQENSNSIDQITIDMLRKKRDAIIEVAKNRAASIGDVVRLSTEDRNSIKIYTDQINATKSRMEVDKKMTDAALKNSHDRKGAIEKENETIRSLNDAIGKQAQDEQYLSEITRLETQKRINASRQAFEAQASFSQLLAVKMAQDAQSWALVFVNAIGNIRDQFAAGFANMVMNGGKFKDMMSNIGKQILQDFIENVIKKMITQWLTMIGVMQATGAGVGIGGGAVGAGAGGGIPGGGAGIGMLPGVGGIIGAGFGASVISQWGENIAGTIGGIVANPIGWQINQAKNILSKGGNVISNVGSQIGKGVSSVGKSIKKAFSGGILGEPVLMQGMETGAMGIAGEKGPEALVSFGEMGMTPQQGANRLMGAGNKVGGSNGGITVHINGTLVEGNSASWQKLIREKIAPEIRRWTTSSPTGPFTRRRGVTS